MFLSQSPVVFIACILGMAFLAILVCFGFYVTRHRSFLRKPDDAEHDMASVGGTARGHGPDGQRHPPVYCVDDLACPPPSYQAVFTRNTAPTHREMHILRHRLEKLQRRRRRSATETPGCETAIRDSEIRCLTQWIERLEMLRDEEEQDAGPVFNPRQTMRLVHSESDPTTLSTISATAQGSYAPHGSSRLQTSATEPRLIQFAHSREVPPPPAPTPTSPNPGGLDIRFTELREQIMRGMRTRYSTAQ